MFEKLNERLRKLTVTDISLIKWSSFFGTLIVAKLFPQLLQINYPVLIVLMILCAIRPMYRMWFKK
jgi:hypothetical protein